MNGNRNAPKRPRSAAVLGLAGVLVIASNTVPTWPPASLLGSLQSAPLSTDLLDTDNPSTDIDAEDVSGDAPDQAATNCVPPPGGMVAWWPFDGPKDRDAPLDLAGYRNGFAESNAIGTYVPGRVNRALGLNGITNLVTVPDHPELSFGKSDFSIDAWVMVPTLAAGRGFRPIVDKRVLGPNGLVYGYTFYLRDGRLAFNMTGEGGSPSIGAMAGSGDVIRYGQWQFVTVSVQRAYSAGGRLYVNGRTVANFNPTSFDPARNPPRFADHQAPLIIGSHNRLSGSSASRSYFNGRIDEVEIYKRALASTEVNAMYRAAGAGKCRPVRHDGGQDGVNTMNNHTFMNACTQDAVGFKYTFSNAQPYDTSIDVPVDPLNYWFDVTAEDVCTAKDWSGAQWENCNPFTPPFGITGYAGIDAAVQDGTFTLGWRSHPWNALRPPAAKPGMGNLVPSNGFGHFGYTLSSTSQSFAYTVAGEWLWEQGTAGTCDFKHTICLGNECPPSFAAAPAGGDLAASLDRRDGDEPSVADSVAFSLRHDGARAALVDVGVVVRATPFALNDLMPGSRLFQDVQWRQRAVRVDPGASLSETVAFDDQRDWGAVVVTLWRDENASPNDPPYLYSFEGFPLAPYGGDNPAGPTPAGTAPAATPRP